MQEQRVVGREADEWSIEHQDAKEVAEMERAMEDLRLEGGFEILPTEQELMMREDREDEARSVATSRESDWRTRHPKLPETRARARARLAAEAAESVAVAAEPPALHGAQQEKRNLCATDSEGGLVGSLGEDSIEEEARFHAAFRASMPMSVDGEEEPSRKRTRSEDADDAMADASETETEVLSEEEEGASRREEEKKAKRLRRSRRGRVVMSLRGPGLCQSMTPQLLEHLHARARESTLRARFLAGGEIRRMMAQDSLGREEEQP
eukprot:GHVU01004946.1.p1 GENE.GHVU01004946.1~~GHVU01004946.1.p1  ORF type:complete len:266 (+),score=49.48 GHVU01004946.1:1-798(+)